MPKRVDIRPEGADSALKVIRSPEQANLPTVLPSTTRKPDKRHWFTPGLLLLFLLLSVLAGGRDKRNWLRPACCSYSSCSAPSAEATGGSTRAPVCRRVSLGGNGRLEGDEIDIDTKCAGRIAKLFVDEGDLTKAGEVLALMDTQDLQASLDKSEALILEALQTLDEARAALDQQKSQLLLAQQEIARAHVLVPQSIMTEEMIDQRQQTLISAIFAQKAAVDRIGELSLLFGLNSQQALSMRLRTPPATRTEQF